MALDRKTRQHLLELGIKEDVIKKELDPLEGRPAELSAKLVSLTTKENFEKLKQKNKESLEEELKHVDKYNENIRKKLEEQENIFKKYSDHISTQVGKLNEEYSRIFGEESAKKITQNITKSFEESESALKESLKKLEEPFVKKMEEIQQKITDLTNERAEVSGRGKRKRREELRNEIIEQENLLKDQQKLLDAEKEKNNDIVNKHKEYAKEIAKTNTALTQQNERLQEAKKLYDMIIKENKELNELSEQTGNHLDSMLESLNPNATGRSNTIFSSIAAQVMMLNNTHEKFSEKMSAFGSFFKDKLLGTFGDVKKAITGLFDYVYEQSIGKAIKLNVEYAELNKSTGGFGNRAQSAVMSNTVFGNLATENNLTRFGIRTEQLNKSFGELSNNLKGFNNMTLETQQSLTVAAAKMENLGVASSQSAKMVETLMSVFNKSADGANDTMDRMAKDALALGISVSKYFQEFESILSKIVGYGQAAEEVFKKVSAISNVTKLSTEQIASFGDGLKTLEGASKVVAGLGAALGGTSLRAQELVKLDPADAFIRIKEELDASGVAFDSLNVGMQRFIAEHVGFSNINDAAKAFNSSLSQMRAEMSKTAESQDELKKSQERSASFQEQYKSLLQNLTILVTPIMKAINFLSKGLMALSEVPIIGFMIPLIGMFAALAFAIRNTWAIGSRFYAMISGSAAAFGQMNASIATGDAAYATLAGTLVGVTAAAEAAALALKDAALSAGAANAAIAGGVATGGVAAAGVTGTGALATGAIGTAGVTGTGVLTTGAIGAETAVVGSAATAGGGGMLAGLGALIFNPITLGILAAGALGYGAYKLIEHAKRPIIPKQAKAGVLPSSFAIPTGNDIDAPTEMPQSGYKPVFAINQHDDLYSAEGQKYAAMTGGPVEKALEETKKATLSTASVAANSKSLESVVISHNIGITKLIGTQQNQMEKKYDKMLEYLQNISLKDDKQPVVNLYNNFDENGFNTKVTGIVAKNMTIAGAKK